MVITAGKYGSAPPLNTSIARLMRRARNAGRYQTLEVPEA
jgi:hypothetical protein